MEFPIQVGGLEGREDKQKYTMLDGDTCDSGLVDDASRILLRVVWESPSQRPFEQKYGGVSLWVFEGGTFKASTLWQDYVFCIQDQQGDNLAGVWWAIVKYAGR